MSDPIFFMWSEGTLTAAVLILFLGRLIQGHPGKIFLILDNLRVHHGRVVRSWVEARRDRIEIFYLPAYSPELNPDELLNSDLKNVLPAGLPARTKTELKRKARSHLWAPRKTGSVHVSTSSTRTEPVDLQRTVRTELVEVRGFSRCPCAGYRNGPTVYAGISGIPKLLTPQRHDSDLAAGSIAKPKPRLCFPKGKTAKTVAFRGSQK